MTHDELLARLNHIDHSADLTMDESEQYFFNALRAVVKLHRPYAPPFVDIDLSKGGGTCFHCSVNIKENSLAIPYPCPTIQVIEKELK